MNASVEENIHRVRDHIRQAATQAGRDIEDITLVGASKTVDQELLRGAISAGMQVFGENRVQEAEIKWPELRSEHPDIELHLIGPLQTNKVAAAVKTFDVIQSLDRPKLAAALRRCRDRGETLPRLLIQVNIGREPQKAGIMPAELDQFVSLCREEHDLEISGLMCIPPSEEDPQPYFVALEEMRRELNLQHCSMGMSGDYATAVRNGATMVRVGSAIFGKRDYGLRTDG